MTNTNNFKNVSTQVALEMLKRETAMEMGIELGENTTSKANGSVGGEITKKLIALGELKLVELMEEQGTGNVELSQLLNQNTVNHNELH